MEEITFNSWMQAGCWFGVLIMILFIVAYYLGQWNALRHENNRINECQYESEYKRIQRHIEEYPVDIAMYYKIKDEIWRLKQLEHKNREKTTGLYTELVCGRFLKIADGIAKNRVKK